MTEFGFDEQEDKLILEFACGPDEHDDQIYMYAKELIDGGFKSFIRIVMTRQGPILVIQIEKPKEVENDGKEE